MEGSDSERLDSEPNGQDSDNTLGFSLDQLLERLKGDDKLYKGFMDEFTKGSKQRQDEKIIPSPLDMDYPDLPKR
ncbi:MAG TPA: hypothetical protein PLG47_00745 [Candidatus Dojkabacteria bacterium]|nr:hypothetical protein [Candidatus Dojkabacteria bacterium]